MLPFLLSDDFNNSLAYWVWQGL